MFEQRKPKSIAKLIPCASMLVAMYVCELFMPTFSGLSFDLALILFYFWMLYRPDLLPPFVLLILGILQDSLVGTPLGCYPLLYIIAYATLLSQRRHIVQESFLTGWLAFILFQLLAETFIVLFGYLFGYVISPFRFAIEMLMGIALYPFVFRLILILYHRIPKDYSKA